MEYVGIMHFNFLLNILKKYHGVQFNMAGNKLTGITIKWDYPGKRCQISMPGYIDNLLIKFKHSCPSKPQLSPYAYLPISYGAKTQFAPNDDALELLDDARKQRIQEIFGALLYNAQAVDNKLLGLSVPLPRNRPRPLLPLSKQSIYSSTVLPPIPTAV